MVNTPTHSHLRLAVALSCIFVFGAVWLSGLANGAAPAQKPDRIVATDYPDLHAAVEAAKTLGVYHVYVPSGIHTLDKTLDLANLTWDPARDKDGKMTAARNQTMIFEGAGQTTILIANTGKAPAVDLSGSHVGMTLRDFCLQTPFNDDGWQEGSNVGILLGRLRNAGGVIRERDDPKWKSVPSAGGHSFTNVRVRGHFKTAAVYNHTSETNGFRHCHFTNTYGDAFIFTNLHKHPVQSPKAPLAISSNVGQYFLDCAFQGGVNNGVGLRVQGGDVTLIQCFFAAKKDGCYAGVYLDGTHHARGISIRDTRMENSHAYCVVAVGAVSDVLLEGGQWISSKENILHLEKVPEKAGPHRYVGNPSDQGWAQNWIVRNLKLSKSFEDDPALTIEKIGANANPTVMRFDGLVDSHIDSNNYYIQRIRDGKREYVMDSPLLVVEKYSRRNTIEVPSREAVNLGPDARGNVITALLDDHPCEPIPALWRSGVRLSRDPKNYDTGVRRLYLNPDTGPSLLNVGIINVNELKDPRTGDVALHDGTGFADKRPRLAVYDGSKWLFFDPATPDAK